jgi:monoamine oxidase
VEVVCDDGRRWHAHKLVCTLPLGVLQADAVRFAPEVTAIRAAAGQMRAGRVCRFTLRFARRLWPETLSFLMTPELLPTVWWTAHPADSHTLTGWVGGPRALPLLGLSAEELKQHAVAAVAQALELPEDAVRTELRGFYTHDWDADPFARGSYAWVAVGGLEASAAMSEPVVATLYFAGEHTDTSGHWGTVQAALGSGVRAAGQILEG